MAGIYLHIPFCSQRCVYCDFYFTTTRKSHASFVAALLTEIAHYGHTYGEREPIETVYFGGGTPSLLSLEDLQTILDAIHTHFDTARVGECTFEMNPEDADVDYLRGLRDLGVDRLSLGVQSFYESDLEFMNRAHTAEEAEKAVSNLRDAGFDDFSIDLIFGLPDQPVEYWAANLEKATRMGAPHISTYSLTVEPRTVLHKQVERGLVAPPSDETVEERYRFTMQYLQKKGYEQYEISNFALPGRRAIHNAAYWNHTNYLGFGPSAHSFWWQGLPAYRWANVANLRQYEALLTQRQPPLAQRDALTLDDLADEYVMLQLRTGDGIDLDHLEKRYGVDLLFEELDVLADLESGGFIEPIRNRRLRLTDRGRVIADTITGRLVSA